MIRSDVTVAAFILSVPAHLYAGLFTGRAETAPVRIMATSPKWSAL